MKTHQTPAMAPSLTRVWFGTTLALNGQRRSFLGQELIKFIQLRSTWCTPQDFSPIYVAYPPRIGKCRTSRAEGPKSSRKRNCRPCPAGSTGVVRPSSPQGGGTRAGDTGRRDRTVFSLPGGKRRTSSR